MKKSILYRWFGLGAVPKSVRPTLESEGIVVLDEGMSGRLVMKDVDGPAKRYRQRTERFLGSLVVTQQRILCHTFRKRQLSIAAGDERLRQLFVDLLAQNRLSLSFESGNFRQGWRGVMTFEFSTDQAPRFLDALRSAGVQQGTA
ncbi:MAG: hypothetical protein AAGH19_02775 [Pseudomonadota bacterium]